MQWLPAAVRSQGKERKLKAGRTLFHSGEPTAGLYEVIRGKVRLVRVDRAGRETILYTAAVGDTIAEASLFAKAYHCDAVATTDAVVRLYSKAIVLAAFRSDTAALQGFTSMLAHQVMDLRTRLEQRNIHSARERVRHYLAVSAGADGRTVVLPGTLKEFAELLGLRHETLYRTLASMTDAGEIERAQRAIRLARAV